MKTINVGTVFSGIGSPEQALERLNVPHKVLFACDNGERLIDVDYPLEMKRQCVARLPRTTCLPPLLFVPGCRHGYRRHAILSQTAEAYITDERLNLSAEWNVISRPVQAEMVYIFGKRKQVTATASTCRVATKFLCYIATTSL